MNEKRKIYQVITIFSSTYSPCSPHYSPPSLPIHLSSHEAHRVVAYRCTVVTEIKRYTSALNGGLLGPYITLSSSRCRHGREQPKTTQVYFFWDTFYLKMLYGDTVQRKTIVIMYNLKISSVHQEIWRLPRATHERISVVGNTKENDTFYRTSSLTNTRGMLV